MIQRRGEEESEGGSEEVLEVHINSDGKGILWG